MNRIWSGVGGGALSGFRCRCSPPPPPPMNLLARTTALVFLPTSWVTVFEHKSHRLELRI